MFPESLKRLNAKIYLKKLKREKGKDAIF